MKCKKNTVAAGIYFAVGIIFGTVLFYAQKNAGEAVAISKTVSAWDVARLAYNNLLWLFSVYICAITVPFDGFHPILAARGTANGYCTAYMLSHCGVRAACAAAVPQCLGILPTLFKCSVHMQERRARLLKAGRTPSVIRQRELLALFLAGFFAAAAETLSYTAFCRFLF